MISIEREIYDYGTELSLDKPDYVNNGKLETKAFELRQEMLGWVGKKVLELYGSRGPEMDYKWSVSKSKDGWHTVFKLVATEASVV